MSYLTIPDITKAAADYPPADPAISYSFSLDPWQQHAVLAIHAGANVLVTAKTGSGKTLVGEYQIAHSLRQKKRVFYTTPIKSLSNQKYYDLKHLFPSASVGIMTGDIKSNPEADIVIMTTEILRNLLFKQNTATAHIGTAGQITLENVDAVIFDECHYINDPDRGHVWEETLILLPPTIHLILLSATIDSPELFAGWLGRAKQWPITLLKTSHRIVPLIHGVYDPSTPVKELPLRALKVGDEAPYVAGAYTDWLKAREKKARDVDDWEKRVRTAHATGTSIAGAGGKAKTVSFTHTLNECVEQLKTRDLLPALFFVLSRKDCERYADQVTGSLIDSSDCAAVKHIISFHLHRYAATLEHLPQYHQIVRLLERGIAFHHSGLLPLLKEIVELLFSRGYVKVLFCTETFAVGLNMPTRTVVFLDMKKPAEEDGFRPLRADEYIQMAGRAGRRGKDTRGVVIYLPARAPLDPDEMRGVLSGSLHPLQSRLQFHYDFITKALHAAGAATDVGSKDSAPLWSAVIESSYWSAQRARAIADARVDLERARAEQARLPLTDAQRTDIQQLKLLEVQMRTSERRRGAAAISQWKDRHMGPVWAEALRSYAQYENAERNCRKLEDSIAAAEADVGDRRVVPILAALERWNAITHGAEGIPCLTEFGTLVTEVNEANPLLVATLYQSKLLAPASAEEVVAVLGAFIVDREAERQTVHPSELRASERVKDVLMTIDAWGQKGVTIDRECGVDSPDTYWSLTTLWVSIASDWMSGISAGEITAKYDIYEGNLMRGIHKVANLVNEWISIATYLADVDMLDKLKDVPALLLRDIAQPESLYLRL